MVRSEASTVKAYLATLPVERRKVIAAVRDVVLRHLPIGYVETMNWGMITYELPLAVYPKTYNRKPLMYAALAAQKNYNALYLMCVYQHSDQEATLRKAFERAGKKLDMGKSCIRFRALDDLPLSAIGELVASMPVPKFIEMYEASRRLSGRRHGS